MARITKKTRAATGALLFAGAATWRRRRRPRPSDVEGMERVDARAEDPDSVPDDDVLIAREESAAAAESARIGGQVPRESDDPAMEPLYEAGEGEQEGWETAEAELVENATHGDGAGNPARDAFTPEVESDRSTAAYGEADEEEPADS
jgi:hypothetical protein